MGNAIKINSDRLSILLSLRDNGWMRPKDLGASDGSRHSQHLARLCTDNLVKRKNKGLGQRRGSYLYKITKAGEAVADTICAEGYP